MVGRPKKNVTPKYQHDTKQNSQKKMISPIKEIGGWPGTMMVQLMYHMELKYVNVDLLVKVATDLFGINVKAPHLIPGALLAKYELDPLISLT